MCCAQPHIMKVHKQLVGESPCNILITHQSHPVFSTFLALFGTPRYERNAKQPQWPQPPLRYPACKRCQTITALHICNQDRLRHGRQRRGHNAPVVNHRCCPRIGGPEHGALKLQSTHTTDLQMLVNGNTVTKPRNIADIDKHGGCLGGVAKAGPQLLTK